jgi:ABC-type transport system substrate-binding protein
MIRRACAAALLILGVSLLGDGGAAGSSDTRNGGVFRIVTSGIDSIDPATSIYAWAELAATCVQLPEVAPPPRVSRDGKTYTFTIRPGFRFNTGEKVTAANFAHAIDRVVSPTLQSGWTQYAQDIVGAQEVLDGKATHVSGVQAQGNTLAVHLTEEARDFPIRTSVVPFCAVPTGLPATPDAVTNSLPGAGPYYIAAYVPGRKLVLERNRFYGGKRPHHVDTYTTEFVDTEQSALNEVAAGKADWADVGGGADFSDLIRRYKVNKSQLYRRPGSLVRYVVLNCSRPLFRGNPRLRQAINFAIDRPALLRARGPLTGTPTDQYLPSDMPGFRDERIYPLDGPDLRKARALARGHTRSGRVVLYVQNKDPNPTQAQILQADLGRIGLNVEIKQFPGPALFQRIFTPGEPFDMTLLGYAPDYKDPYAVLDLLLNGHRIGKTASFNISYFDSPKYNRLLARAARLTGSARYRAYGRLDVDLARNAAPLAAYSNETVFSFVSKRAGCLVFNPNLDLTRVCLK